jgi:hypothetical protein
MTWRGTIVRAAMYHKAGSPIPELTFGTPHQVFDEGRTKPILFQMERDGVPDGLWVVKAKDKRPSVLLVEMASSDFCAHSGLRTPEIAFARFPSALREYDTTSSGLAAKRMHEANRGELVFCSRFLGGATKLMPENLKWPRGDQDEHAILLFVLDAFLWHHDRTTQNPNALWHDGKLVAIDHGRAMFRIEETDETGLGLDFSQTRTDDWSRHIVFESLRRRWQRVPASETLDAFGRRAQALDESAMRALARRWPPELDKGGMREEIFRFVLCRRAAYDDIATKIRATFVSG